MRQNLSLGLDLSTQSITAVLIDIDNKEVVYEKSLDYLADSRLNSFGITENYILPPKKPGEAKQPVELYIAAVEAILKDIASETPGHGIDIRNIRVINSSVQQHTHIYLNRKARDDFNRLAARESLKQGSLWDVLSESFALPFAKTWRTSDTSNEVDFVRQKTGGKDKLIDISGSNGPLRFSAFSIRKTALDYPEQYNQTEKIHLLSTFMAAILTGKTDLPVDYGNACGFSLMNYREKIWSHELLSAVGEDIIGGSADLLERLPTISSAKYVGGTIAAYFIDKYGFNPECLVVVGSGDNAQSKVMSEGTLLSLGTSLVLMAEFDGRTFDMSGNCSAMYDGLDRPFMFGCRTNGALQWDTLRARYGQAKHNYEAAEKALTEIPPGNDGRFFLWQAETESFPLSPSFDEMRIGYEKSDFKTDYAGLMESTLGILYLYSKDFITPSSPVYVTGGASKSSGILRRIAAIWKKDVLPVSDGGAALGAAVAGACVLKEQENIKIDEAGFAASFLQTAPPLKPTDSDIKAYHGEGAFLDKLSRTYANVIE